MNSSKWWKGCWDFRVWIVLRPGGKRHRNEQSLPLPIFCLKEISVTSNQKKNPQPLQSRNFLGGERCFTNGPHPKMYKNACWDHGSSDESWENPPRLDAQGSDFRIKVPWVFTNEKVTWANTNQSSIYYLFQGCFPLLYLCSLITHSVFVFDADFKSSNVASDFFLNICLKQFSQKIVGFFWWKCDRKMAMNFSIRRFMSTMRWRRCWRRLSLAFLSAICSYILDLSCWWCFILYHGFHHHHSPPFGNDIFLELLSKNRTYKSKVFIPTILQL